MSIKCLSNITITQPLADAIESFESVNGDLEIVAGDFIQALVRFAKEMLEDHENFYNEPDRPAAITLCLFENGADPDLLSKYDEIEEKLHTIEGGDEIYNLIIEVINTAVLSFDFPSEPQPQNLTRITGYKYNIIPLQSREGTRSIDSRPDIMLGDAGNWESQPGDYQFNNVGERVLMAEIDDSINIPDNAMFVSDKVSVSICCAAAWLQVLAFCKQDYQQRAYIAERAKIILMTISLYSECHPVPMEGKEAIKLFYLSRWVVSAFELTEDRVMAEFGLINNRRLWTIGQQTVHNSEVFKAFTEWLREAALGRCEWPGASGEAKNYLQQYEMDGITLYDRIKVFNGVVVLDGRGFAGEINPRHLIEWGQEHAPDSNMTLIVQDRFLRLFKTNEGLLLLRSGNSTRQELETPHSPLELALPAMQYTLGRIIHTEKGSPLYSDRGVWEALTSAECSKRAALGIAGPEGGWKFTGNYGGYSSHLDGYLLTIPEVTAIMQQPAN